MMNSKQQEVLDHIAQTMKEKYPEFGIISVTEIHPNSYWISHTVPSDEDKEDESRELLAELVIDTLTDYGFYFQFVVADPEEIKEMVA